VRGRLLVLPLAFGLVGTRGAAQTADTLAAARELYNALTVERAVPMFRRVVSSSWPYPVSTAERVTAFEYLGASFALLNAGDSAVSAFRAAIETDPFADLDAQRFTPSQVSLFRAAQDSVFVLAARPVDSVRIDPRTEHVTLRVLSTHAATIQVSLLTPDRETIPLYSGSNRGLREVTWNGLLTDGSFAPAGRYVLVVGGTSSILTRTDSARVYFDLKRDGPALTDTLPSLRPAELVPGTYGGAWARHDLLRALAVAAGAVVIADALPNGSVDGGHGRAAVVAGAAIVAAAGTLLYRRARPDLGSAVAENARRRAARAAQNEAIRQANADRLNRTRLVITPAAGAAP
jgi:hypothetical protein